MSSLPDPREQGGSVHGSLGTGSRGSDVKDFLAIVGAGTLIIAGGLAALSLVVDPAAQHPFVHQAALNARASAPATDAAPASAPAFVSAATAEPAIRDVTREPRTTVAVAPTRLIAEPEAATAAAAPASAETPVLPVSATTAAEPAPPPRKGAAGCTAYRTYDPDTRTYRGFDGRIHACP